MQLKSVRNYSRPSYPLKEAFTARPELFDRHLPLRWSVGGISAGALAAALLGGCAARDGDKTVNQPNTVLNQSPGSGSPSSTSPPQSQQAAPADTFYVAPLFLHGNGQGVTGCVMIAPPVFLSEAEACSLIVRTLEENALPIDKQDTILATAHLVQHQVTTSAGKCVDSTTELPFVLSGYSSAYATGFRFISFQDAEQLSPGGCTCAPDSTLMMCSSVSSYDLTAVAAEACTALRETDALNAAVFYDPCAATREESLSLLRQQVLDFVNYLGAHQVIPNTSVLVR